MNEEDPGYISFDNGLMETITILNSDNLVNIKKITLYDSTNLIEMLRIKYQWVYHYILDLFDFDKEFNENTKEL